MRQSFLFLLFISLGFCDEIQSYSNSLFTENNKHRAGIEKGLLNASGNIKKQNKQFHSPLAATDSAVVLNDLKLFVFTESTGHNALEDYELSTNRGASWKGFDASFARKRTTPDGAPTGKIDVYLDNNNYAPGAVLVRLKGTDKLQPAIVAVSNAAFTKEKNYDRWKPGLLRFDSPYVFDWIDPFGIEQTEYFRYQVTFDGGETVLPAPSKPAFLGNLSLGTNQFGVRTVNENGRPVSGWIFYSPTVTADIRHTVNLVLKPYDSSVTASTVNGSKTVTLSNNNYRLQIGDRIIIGNNASPGKGRRGTDGVGGEWPAYEAPDSASIMNHFKDYVVNQYVWAKNNGYVYRINANGITKYYDTHPDRNKAIARPLEGFITAVAKEGLLITLDHAAKLSVSGASVYYDNSKPLNDFGDTVSNNCILNLQRGRYAIGQQIDIQNKIDFSINARGVTLFSPAGCRSASFVLQGCTGYRINQDDKSDGKFVIEGNYTYNTMGFKWEADSQRGNEHIYPPLDETFYNDVFTTMPMFGLWSSYGRADGIEARNGVHALLQNTGGVDVRWTNVSVKRDNIIGVEGKGTPYFGSYYWGINWEDARGGYIDGITLDYDKLLNGVEVFDCTGVVFKNIKERNAHNSMNGSAKCVYENVTVIVEPYTRTFQNNGHSIFENNMFQKRHSWSYKNRIQNIRINILGTINRDSTPNVYPLGVWDRGGITTTGGYKTTDGFEIVNFIYRRPDLTAYSPWQGQAIRTTKGAYLKNVRVEGKFGEADIKAAGLHPFGAAAIALEGSTEGEATVFDSVVAPTIYIPATVVQKNVVTTERPVVVIPGVYAGADKTISDSTTTFTGTVTWKGTAGTIGWNRMSGPSLPTIVSPNAVTTKITGLVKGEYVFRLTATDPDGLQAFDEMKLVVK